MHKTTPPSRMRRCADRNIVIVRRSVAYHDIAARVLSEINGTCLRIRIYLSGEVGKMLISHLGGNSRLRAGNPPEILDGLDQEPGHNARRNSAQRSEER